MTPTAQPKIHIERMMYRSTVSVAGETAASYALIKLIPAGGAMKSLPLNLALVLDVSGSMYEEDGTGKSRLTRVQEAALLAVEKLKPEDHLSIIAFAHDAQVVLPATPLSEKTGSTGSTSIPAARRWTRVSRWAWRRSRRTTPPDGCRSSSS